MLDLKKKILFAIHYLELGGAEKSLLGLLDSLEIPSTHKVWAMIALGYPAAGDKTPARKTDVVSWVE